MVRHAVELLPGANPFRLFGRHLRLALYASPDPLSAPETNVGIRPRWYLRDLELKSSRDGVGLRSVKFKNGSKY